MAWWLCVCCNMPEGSVLKSTIPTSFPLLGTNLLAFQNSKTLQVCRRYLNSTSGRKDIARMICSYNIGIERHPCKLFTGKTCTSNLNPSKSVIPYIKRRGIACAEYSMKTWVIPSVKMRWILKFCIWMIPWNNFSAKFCVLKGQPANILLQEWRTYCSWNKEGVDWLWTTKLMCYSNSKVLKALC